MTKLGIMAPLGIVQVFGGYAKVFQKKVKVHSQSHIFKI